MRNSLSKFALAAGVSLALVFTFSCSGGDDDGGSSGVGGGGSCVGNKGNNMANYKTKQIGSKTWMLENLNYNVAGSRCYGEGSRVMVNYDIKSGKYIYATLSNAEIEANNVKYGRLYDWETAKTICPSGWHLPSDDDWQELVNFAGGIDVAGEKLKAKNSWDEDNGTDDYGFSALPGGHLIDGNFNGECSDCFFDVGNFGSWWSSSGLNYWWGMTDFSKNVTIGSPASNGSLMSVRCVKD